MNENNIKIERPRPHKEIGDRLRKIRKDQGWIQERVAERVKMGRANYARVERGEIRPSMELQNFLTFELNVNLLWILFGEGKPYSGSETIEGSTDKLLEVAGIEDDLLRKILIEMMTNETIRRNIVMTYVSQKYPKLD
ncbi:MAG: helix-turn-helix transcriptional regulator [bacterium]|nr:helix-turn-helix transcriptional regulator [bacterium]